VFARNRTTTRVETLMTMKPQPGSLNALKTTSLHELHVTLEAKMAPFAGYDMPLNYAAGILREHAHTRDGAGLFDVSHMGQAFLVGPDHETTARALEALAPTDALTMERGAMRYSQLLNDNGGVIDDLLITRYPEEHDGSFMIVVNAARKEVDYAFIKSRLPGGVTLQPLHDRALLSLQGPEAINIIERHAPAAAHLTFMTAVAAEFDGLPAHISRSGYTGEDGFEISVNAAHAEEITRVLLDEENVLPIGLGARDTLRLEAGLCLYGQELNETISPVEAGLAWSIPRRRREEGGFPGAGRIQRELRYGPSRRRVGLLFEGRAAAREGAAIFAENDEQIGAVTSGAYSPTLKRAIAMGYVHREHAQTGSILRAVVRGAPVSAEVTALPFVPNSYFRRTAKSPRS
jgi:aminomethyltransferase